MEYKKETIAICLSDIKQAALFFNRVYPFDQNEFVTKEILTKDNKGSLLHKDYEFKSEIHRKAFFDLIIGTSNYSNKMHKQIIKMYSLWRLLLYGLFYQAKRDFIANTLQEHINKKSPLEIADILIQQLSNPDLTRDLSDFYISNTPISISENETVFFRDAFLNPLKSLHIVKPSVVLPSRYITQIDSSSDDITLTLNNIFLIDTSKSSWEQIMAIRKDPDLIRKLRNLKLFTYSNYQDKPKSFIEDDLLSKIDHFHTTCKEYGFQLKLSALSTTLSSKNLLASVAAGISTAFLGGPLIGIGTAVVIEIGNLAIEITKGYQAFTKLKNDHPLAYIISLQKDLKK
jgi:hypothetical protein